MPEPRPRLLIIDDEQLFLWVIADLCTDLGFEVTTAESGWDGVRVATSVIPDVILLDVNMPAYTGWDALRQLRANEETCHIPVVMMTGCEIDPSDPKQPCSSANAMLTKPFASTILAEILRRVLAGSGVVARSPSPVRRDT